MVSVGRAPFRAINGREISQIVPCFGFFTCRTTVTAREADRMSANHRDADDANPPRCCEHGGEGGWVRALAVATFDVGTGHTLEQVNWSILMLETQVCNVSAK